MRPVHLSRVESDPHTAAEKVELLDVGLPDLSGAQLMATLEEAIAQEPMTNVIARLRAIAAATPEIVAAPEPEIFLEPIPQIVSAEPPAEPTDEVPLALTSEMLVKPRPAQPDPVAEVVPPKDTGADAEKIFDEDFFEFI